MLVFISGSINSGKTTISKILAKRINAVHLNVDNLNDMIPGFNLATDLDKSMTLAIEKINEYSAQGKDVVANYVVRLRDYERFEKEITTHPQIVVTLAPRIEVAQSKRGNRDLSEWEKARIKYHYETGVATPEFGFVVDNSDISPQETVDEIMHLLENVN